MKNPEVLNSSNYVKVDEIIDFLPDTSVKKSPAQKLCDSKTLISIYESGWWRGNKIFEYLMGISMKDEMDLIHKILDPGKNDTILDLACGPGFYARSFAQNHPERTVYGLDLSMPMLEYASEKAGKLNIKNLFFVYADAENLPFKDSSFDAVNCCGALHLFPNINKTLSEVHRILKPGGKFSMALTMKTNTPFNKLKSGLDKKYMDVNYYYVDEFSNMLEKAGFEPKVYHCKILWMLFGGICKKD